MIRSKDGYGKHYGTAAGSANHALISDGSILEKNINSVANTLVLRNAQGLIVSTLASGKAPFVVASTDLVANLNANYLDGITKTELLNKFNDYLSKSGGTVAGALTVSGNNKLNAPLIVATPSMNYNAYIKFTDGGSTTMGFLGVSAVDKPVFRSSDNTNYTLWHSGNDGSDSGLDADTLDTYHADSVFTYEGTTNTNGENTLWNALGTKVYTNALPEGLTTAYNYGQTLSFGKGSARFDMYVSHLSTNKDYDTGVGCIYVRSGWNNYKCSWRKLAFVDSNVESATKLKTARSLWGNSFDGSSDISGSIRLVDGEYDGSILLNSGNLTLASSKTNTQYTNILLAPNGGNVGIGISSPNYKLHVNGTLNATTLYQNGTSLDSILNGYLKRYFGVYGLYNKFLRFTRGAEKGWLRFSVGESTNSSTGAYAEYIVSWSYDLNNTDKAIYVNCIYSVNKDKETAVVAVRNTGATYDLYYKGDHQAGFFGYQILGYSESCTIVNTEVTAVSEVPTATVTSSLITLNAKALKLANSRTIWGQSFNGTADVSGDMNNVGDIKMGGNKCILAKSSSGTLYNIFYPLWSDGVTYLNYGPTAFHLRDSGSNTVMYINSSRNIGIGTASPAYKLDVRGTLSATTIYQNGTTLADTYLSLSGGTLSGSTAYILTIDRSSQNPLIAFNANKTLVGFLGILETGYPIFVDNNGSTHKIWCENNLTPSNYMPKSGGTFTGSIQAPVYVLNGGVCYLDIDASKNLIYYDGTKRRIVYNSGNFTPGDYLLKSGGTITGSLKINSSLSFGGTDASDITLIFAENPSGTQSHLVFYMTDDSNDGFVFRSKIYGTDTPYDILKIYLSGINATLSFSSTASISTSDTISSGKLATFGTALSGKAAIKIGNNYIIGAGDLDILNSQGNWVILGNGIAASGWPTYVDGNEVRLRYGTSHTLGLLLDSSGNISMTKDATISGKLGVGESPTYRLQLKESSTDYLFSGQCGTTMFKMHKSAFINYVTTTGGYVMYPGAGTTEALRLETLNKDGSWKGKGFILYLNGNMTIGGNTDNGNKLNVEGSFRAAGDGTIVGNLKVGGNANRNYISFRGTTNDGNGSHDHTYIGENIYGGTEQAELVLFKGNDVLSGASGPDRIRHIAALHKFLVYSSSALSGTFEAICASSVPETILDVNYNGISTPKQITSTVAGGTAPFSVTSTTKVTNLNADYWDNYHSYLGIPYSNKYTKTGTGTWYLKISTAAWSHSIDTIVINTAGNNCSGNYVINSGSRSTNFWGYGVNYNNGGLLGVYKKITNSCDIYIKVNNPTVYIYTTFSATITEESVDDSLYTPVPGNNGLFCNYINDLSFKVTSSPGTDSRTIYFVT